MVIHMHETRKKYTVLLLSAPIGSGHRLAAEALEQAFADQIASGSVSLGQHWTADCAEDGTIVVQETQTAGVG